MIQFQKVIQEERMLQESEVGIATQGVSQGAWLVLLGQGVYYPLVLSQFLLFLGTLLEEGKDALAGEVGTAVRATQVFPAPLVYAGGVEEVEAGGHADSCIEIVFLQADGTGCVVAPMIGGYHCLWHEFIEMRDIKLKILLFRLLLSPRPSFPVNKHNEQNRSRNQESTSHVAKYQENRRTTGLHGRRHETRVDDIDHKDQLLRCRPCDVTKRDPKRTRKHVRLNGGLRGEDIGSSWWVIHALIGVKLRLVGCEYIGIVGVRKSDSIFQLLSQFRLHNVIIWP